MPDDNTPTTAPRDAPPTLAGDAAALHFLAFQRNDDAAYLHWSALPDAARRDALLDRHVFLSVLSAAATRLAAIDRAGQTRLLAHVERLQTLVVDTHDGMRAARLPFGIEWFQGLECWAAALIAQHLFARTEEVLQLAYRTGSSSHPGVHQALRATEALLYATTGRQAEAERIALRYAMRPYLLPDRRLRPTIYRRLLAALALLGRMAEYRALLWRGLADVYFDRETRGWFVQQARATYRGLLGVLLRADVPLRLRVQFGLRVAGDAIGRLRLARWLRVDRALDWGNFALAYYLQYGRAARRVIGPVAPAEVQDRILVTRAMGGLGDLLMMTPGLRALRAKHPGTPIHFAVPRRFFALLEGNTDVEPVDIESPELEPASYRLWFDLTDCPASRVESRQLPNVRSDRVQIFAAAMGVSRGELARSGTAPGYTVSADESAAARAFIARINPQGRPCVGIQLHSAESYRDFPHNEALVAALAQDCCVLLFDAQLIAGFEAPNVHKVVLPLRQSFAVASLCDVLVAPDSSFVHLGAAFGKPVVAMFGPIDGRVRCRPFPTVRVVTPPRSEFPCMPCWRSEYTPCRLTGQRESACLRALAPAAVAAQVRALIPTR